MTDSLSALRSHLGHTRLDQSLHQPRWYRLAARKLNGSLCDYIALQISGVRALNSSRHWVETAVVFPRRVVHEHSPIESERRNAVAELLGGVGSCGANGLAQFFSLPS